MNDRLLKKLSEYVNFSTYLRKIALVPAIPNIQFSAKEKQDMIYLMYLLNHSYYNGKFSSLINSLMSATNISTLKRILNNSMIYYVFDDKISEAVQNLIEELVERPVYQKIDVNVQKALNKLFNANLAEDGILGSQTQKALDVVKSKFNVTSNQEVIKKLLNIYNNPQDAGY